MVGVLPGADLFLRSAATLAFRGHGISAGKSSLFSTRGSVLLLRPLSVHCAPFIQAFELRAELASSRPLPNASFDAWLFT